VIGWIVGGISALLFLVFSKYISADIGILASLISGILFTGALHEDGFADTCDGFGGGWTKEKILQIMKDSRIGVFGAIGLFSILSAKFLLLKELPQFNPDLGHPSSNIFFNSRYFILTVIAAHSLSRLMPVWVIQFSQYVSGPDTSKSKPIADKKLSIANLILAAFLGLLPFTFLTWHFLLAILPVIYVTYELKKYFEKWIGGYTGDCLGAIQQVSEIVFYLSVIIIWRFIT
jgi:adenosylcobinamide-GDP ribazoletransferase